MTEERTEKLRELGFHLAPSYDQMYEKLATHKVETGTLEVNKDDDNELFVWTKEQKTILFRHYQGKSVPLSDDKIQNLKSLGFEKDRLGKGLVSAENSEKNWSSMLQTLLNYQEEHGSFPTLTMGKESQWSKVAT